MRHRAHTTNRLLTVFLAVLTLAPAPDRGVAGESRSLIHVVDVSALDSGAIDTVLGLPGVDAWLEFGDTCLLAGDERVADGLARAVPAATREVVPAGRDELVLARGASPESLAGAQVLAGRGRYAVLRVAPGAALRGTGESAPTLDPLPWNTALVQRPDRAFPGAGAPAATVPILAAAVGAVDLGSYTGLVTDLVAFGPRVTTAASFPAVTSHLATQLQALGLAVRLDAFTISGKTRYNVIGEIAGDVTPDDVYVVCGHYDSVAAGPGADDNASGAAAVVEMARVLGQYRYDSTIRFICFAGEEQGLVGSSAYVNDLLASGELGTLKGVVNMDMIAYCNTPAWDVLLEGQAGTSQPLLALLSQLVPQVTSLTGYVSTNPYGSDHIPFISKGVNAVLTIEYEDWYNPYYHAAGDTMATLQLPFALEIVKLNVAATATQAGIKGGYLLPYGAGLAGSGGHVPRLSGTGSTNLGDDASLAVEGGLGAAPGWLFVGLASAALPLKGGTLLVDPAGALLVSLPLSGPAGVPGAGSAQLDVTLPTDPALSGAAAFLQAGWSDPGAAAGLSLSNALELVVGI